MFLPVGQSEARLAGLAQEASWSPRLESAIKMVGFVLFCFVGVFNDDFIIITCEAPTSSYRASNVADG